MKNQKGIINMAIVALVLGLLLLTVGIYMTQNKKTEAPGIKEKNETSAVEQNIDVKNETTSTPTFTTKNPATDTEIEKKFQEVINSEKEVSGTFSDKPVDVMSE